MASAPAHRMNPRSWRPPAKDELHSRACEHRHKTRQNRIRPCRAIMSAERRDIHVPPHACTLTQPCSPKPVLKLPPPERRKTPVSWDDKTMRGIKHVNASVPCGSCGS